MSADTPPDPAAEQALEWFREDPARLDALRTEGPWPSSVRAWPIVRAALARDVPTPGDEPRGWVLAEEGPQRWSLVDYRVHATRQGAMIAAMEHGMVWDADKGREVSTASVFKLVLAADVSDRADPAPGDEPSAGVLLEQINGWADADEPSWPHDLDLPCTACGDLVPCTAAHQVITRQWERHDPPGEIQTIGRATVVGVYHPGCAPQRGEAVRVAAWAEDNTPGRTGQDESTVPEEDEPDVCAGCGHNARDHDGPDDACTVTRCVCSRGAPAAPAVVTAPSPEASSSTLRALLGSVASGGVPVEDAARLIEQWPGQVPAQPDQQDGGDR